MGLNTYKVLATTPIHTMMVDEAAAVPMLLTQPAASFSQQ